MKSYTIIGWAYEAAFHCNECAEKRFPVIRVNESGRVLGGVDNEGNEIVPVFADSGCWGETCDDCQEYLTDKV